MYLLDLDTPSSGACVKRSGYDVKPLASKYIRLGKPDIGCLDDTFIVSHNLCVRLLEQCLGLIVLRSWD